MNILSERSNPESQPALNGGGQDGQLLTHRRRSARRLQAWILPAVLIGVVVTLGLLPRVQVSDRLAQSVFGVAGILAILFLVLFRIASRKGRKLYYEPVTVKAHYVQLVMHTAIYAYWAFYWPRVFRYLPLLVIQLAFVYLVDMLISWFRRDKWILGFGAFPIVMSTNLFLWFKDDWFALQLLMLLTAVVCKEFIRWTRNGHRTHIFNPSAIGLFVFSIGLILSRNTQMTWGAEIAAALRQPPHMYIELFLIGLVVQALFSVTLMTLSAAAALYVLNLIYTSATGVYYFVDTGISVSLFLGLHLLVTDPATSPQTSWGKVLFGSLYGSLVFGIYQLLSTLGAPLFGSAQESEKALGFRG